MNAELARSGRTEDACGREAHGQGDKKLNDEIIRSLLFKQVEKPKGLVAVKAINVYDNRYRINLWAQYDQDGLTKTKIAASYFAVLDGDELHIRSGLDSCESPKKLA